MRLTRAGMCELKTHSTLPELSVVAPLHNEAGNVCTLFAAIRAAVEPLGWPFEVLLVDDGSTDATGRLLDEIAAADPRLSPIHLEGNFGEAAALCAGFEQARGRVILTLDGDLQNDPADLPHLLALLSCAPRSRSSLRSRSGTGPASRAPVSWGASWPAGTLPGCYWPPWARH